MKVTSLTSLIGITILFLAGSCRSNLRTTAYSFTAPSSNDRP